MKPIQHGGNVNAIARQLGLDACPEVALDFSVNVNPLGPPPAVRRILMQGEATVAVYPDEYARPAGRALAAAHDLPPDAVVVGNGSTEIFGWILQALRPRRVGWLAPCYGGYREVCEAHGIAIQRVHTLRPATGFALPARLDVADDVDLLFIGSPNNPTGRRVPAEDVRRLARENPARTIVVDASFADFVGPPDAAPFSRGVERPENLVVVKSLTKFFCIPGLRLGMAWGPASLMDRIRAVRLPWSVNGLAQGVAPHLYADTDYLQRSRAQTRHLRDRFREGLGTLPGVTVFPSDANFLLLGLPADCPAPRLQEALLRHGILIRSCGDFDGLGMGYCRLAVRPEAEQDRLLAAWGNIGAPRSSCGAGPKPRAIMVVGTTSNAGKSIVAAGLCRLLARRGIDVAPFKAQNMALNSYVTADGGEMGRAQVTQAVAAGVPPHTDMNPVLLKPLGENGSQVIVNGRPIGNFKARAYYAMKSRMRRAAHEAYDRLAARHEWIVLEGAGSPAEINLMEEDFVNMDMAAYAEARTVLVADIDRGGVFATVLGTVHLLPARHRRLLAGVIINKFRGDVSLLDSGIRDIEAMTGVPVLGVLPYLPDLRIEDEDSLGLEGRPRAVDAALDVAVIRLPRISNFTDYLAMECDAGVRVRYVATVEELGQPDLVVLPGTKNTRADLQWLHDSGLGDHVLQSHARGVPVIGICGGFQMLGTLVTDDEGVEGEPGQTPGLAMLPTITHLRPRKELAQVEGVTDSGVPFAPAGVPFNGYEIHAGETERLTRGSAPLRLTARRGTCVDEAAGDVSEDGRVFGCYIHGLFDAPDLRRALWHWLCDQKGLCHESVTVAERNALTEFDRLADVLETHLCLDGLIP